MQFVILISPLAKEICCFWLKSRLSDPTGTEKNEIDLSEYRHKIAEALEILKIPDISPSKFNETLISLIDKITFDRKKSEIEICYKI